MKRIVIHLIKKLLKILTPIFVNLFHIVYYHSTNTWLKNKFLGFEILQCPFDLYNYQELLYEVKPRFIIQTGIAGGGSLLYFAKLFDMMNSSPEIIVIGIDINISDQAKKLNHPRIHMIEGSSISDEVIEKIKDITKKMKGFVILDSDHSKAHVLSEIMIYKDFVERDSFLVVEDTNINGHPVSPFCGSGPMEAIEEFLSTNTEFIRENKVWERNMISFHRKGWLKKL